MELIKEGILPVILGGSQDLTYAQYIAYQKLEETVNIVSVDASFDLGTTDQPINSFSFLGKIVLHEQIFLFNFSNILSNIFRWQRTDRTDEQNFILIHIVWSGSQDMEEVEPIVRNADIMSFDITAIRQSDAPEMAMQHRMDFTEKKRAGSFVMRE